MSAIGALAVIRLLLLPQFALGCFLGHLKDDTCCRWKRQLQMAIG
jgi:hypothetical protein